MPNRPPSASASISAGEGGRAAPGDDDRGLDGWRAQIDAIDHDIHWLIEARAALVDRVHAVKARESGGALPFRMGREAAILFTRLGAAAGPTSRFPAPAVLRIWRELIGTFSYQQRPFSVGVVGGAEALPVALLARDHAGAMAPLVVEADAPAVLRALIEGRVHLAVLPVPEPGEAAPWWPLLLQQERAAQIVAAQIVARLPLVPMPGLAATRALVVGLFPPEPSGHDDATLIAVTPSDRVSRARVRAAVEGCGFTVLAMLAATDPEQPEGQALLFEVEGFATPTDARVVEAAQAGLSPYVIGAYARPLG